METMKAVGLYKYLPIDQEESLLDLVIPKPEAKGRDILVKVKAIGVNPVDYKVRSPKDKVETTPKILGWDVAGIVEAVGEGVSLFKPGDEVYYAGSITRAGGNAEYHLVDERIVGKKPVTLDFATAAAFPLTSITAYEGLFERMTISKNAADNKGKTILIIGAAGGVGSIAIQLAKWAGLTVIGTASRPETINWAKSLGADVVISHKEDLLTQLKKEGFDTVNYIFCLNYTEPNWVAMAKAIAPQGKICSIVETKEPLDIQLLKGKSATFAWETMFTRSQFETPDMIAQHQLLNEVADLIDAGKIKSTLQEKLSPVNAANLKLVHAKLESGSVIGKITLEGF